MITIKDYSFYIINIMRKYNYMLDIRESKTASVHLIITLLIGSVRRLGQTGPNHTSTMEI